MLGITTCTWWGCGFESSTVRRKLAGRHLGVMTWVWPGPLRVSEVKGRNTCNEGVSILLRLSAICLPGEFLHTYTTVCLAKRQYYLKKFPSVKTCKELFRATDKLLGKNATPDFRATHTDQLLSYFLDFFTSKITKITENFYMLIGNVLLPFLQDYVNFEFPSSIWRWSEICLKNCSLKTC